MRTLADAPSACATRRRSFLKLCKTKYYNFCLFHNVQVRGDGRLDVGGARGLHGKR